MGKRNWYDMREFMEFVEKKGDLTHVSEEVDPEWEVNGITRIGLQEFAPAIVFDRIKGMDFPMVTNLLGADRRFYVGNEKRCPYHKSLSTTLQVRSPGQW